MITVHAKRAWHVAAIRDEMHVSRAWDAMRCGEMRLPGPYSCGRVLVL